MVTVRDPDELVAFPDVSVIGSTIADLLCRISRSAIAASCSSGSGLRSIVI
jgi:hypothetical protein